MSNYLIYPMKKVSITQTYSGNTSHGPHATGTPKDYPIDDNCGDAKKSGYFCCPCDEIVIWRVYGVGNSGTNTVFMRSTSPVVFADGTKDYACILVMHPDDDALKNIKKGQKFTRKTRMFLEGKDGEATGYHLHVSVGKGDFTGTGWVQNSNDKWVISCTGGGTKPEDAFYIDKSFTTIQNAAGLNFKNLPEQSDSSKPLLTTEEVAQQVIAGDWENGDERKKRLTAAGYDYATVQKEVDSLMNPSTSTAFKNYDVVINTPVLYVRKGPGTNYAVAMTVKNNERYTIVGEQNGFGKLWSGAGWISLAYTNRA